jgi:hypothetical protein
MPKQSRYGESLSVTISSLNAEHKITHYILYRYVIGQPTSSIDFKKISERGTVLIVDLSDLGHEPAAIFGAIIIKHLSRRPTPRRSAAVVPSLYRRVSELRSSARYSARAASEAYFSRSRINSFRSSTKKYGTPCSATARPLFHSVLVPTMPHYWESNRP